MSTNPSTTNRILVVGLFASFAVIATLFVSQSDWMPTAHSAQPQTERPEHPGGEDHAKKEAELHKTMSGTLDIFYDLDEITVGKPTLSGVTFAGLVDVTGKELLLFAKGQKEQWLIDPDYILTIRINKAK